MHSSPFLVPETVTFEQAIALTQSLLSRAGAGELPEPEIAAVNNSFVNPISHQLK